MANGNLETSLVIKARTEGGEQIEALADELQGLGKEASAAAPGVEALADGLTALEQEQVQQALGSVADELQDVATAAQAAQAGLDDLDVAALAADIELVGLDAFVAELERLAAQGGALAPKFAEAAQELRALQQGASTGGQAMQGMGRDARTAQQELGQLGGVADGLQTKLSAVAKAVGGLFAVSKIKSYASDMIAVADAYGQMASRVEQATSSVEEYELVQRRLLETAGATYRPLEEAQELYIRTADALRSLGYNTEAALDVTDSFSYLLVNNAASAERASSAIDAYSKAIQSGKLDAMGWQTIMAAMPTVVDAIAESTGRSTAEVRELGVTGKLAVGELNEALRKTVEANKAVAASMPTTVADALTNLSTVWSAYIGEANRASGATDKLVALIGMVSDNLDTLVNTAMKAGNVLVAVFATRAVLAVKAYATAALSAGAAVETAAAASVRHGAAATAAAAGVNRAATATAAHGAAAASAARGVSAHAAATASQGAAAATAASGLSGFARVLSALKFTPLMIGASVVMELATKLLFAKSSADKLQESLEGVATAADLGSADGVAEFAAELEQLGHKGEIAAEKIDQALSARLKKLGEEDLEALRTGLQRAFEDGGEASKTLEAALDAVSRRLDEIAARKDWAQTLITNAEAARFALSEVQQAFDALASRSDAAVGAALKGMMDGADLGSVAGIDKLLADLKQVQDSAYATGEQIDQALGQRLAQLTAKELREFSIMAEMAFNGAAESAGQLARVNEQVLAASFAKLGVSAVDALGGIGPAAADAMASVENIVSALAGMGVEGSKAAHAIELAMTAAARRADSLDAVTELESRMKGLADQGLLSADALKRVGEALAEQKARIEDVVPGIQSVEEAFRRLGVTTDRELRLAAEQAGEAFERIRDSGQASARELRDAFAEWAGAAVAASGGIIDAAVEAEARAAGLMVELDASGRVVVKTLAEAAARTQQLAAETKAAADAARDVGDAWQETGAAIEESMPRAAAKHNLMVQGVAQAWLEGAAAASRYAREANDAVFSAYQAGELHINQLSEAANAYVAAMEALERRQSALRSGAAQGVKDLELRLLELNGTEAEIAAARLARDKDEIARQIAMMEIERERAQMRGNAEQMNSLRKEISLLEQQLGLLDKIYAAERKQAKQRTEEAAAPKRPPAQQESTQPRAQPMPQQGMHAGPSSQGVTGGASGGAAAGNTVVNITLQPGVDLSSRSHAEAMARQLMPAIKDLERRGAW